MKNEYKYNKILKDGKLCQLVRKSITLNRKELGLEFEDVANELGMSESTLNNKLKPAKAENDLTLTEFIHFLELTGDMRALEYIATKFEHSLMPKRAMSASTLNISILADRTALESADVFRVAKESLLDGELTQEEALKLLKEIEEADKTNAELRATLLSLVDID